MTSYRTSMRQALEEMYQNLNESNLDLMRKAAGGAKQTLKMKDGKIGMDSFTASAIMQIYDKVNDKNRKTMENLLNDGKKADIVKLMKFAMSKVNASYEEFEEEFGLDEEKGPRQLVNPNKEIMVVKKNRVIVIDKKDKDKYMKKGWTLAEEGELDEAKYTGKLMRDKSVVDYVKSQQEKNRKKGNTPQDGAVYHGANWVDIAADAIGMNKMSLSKKKAFDWDSEYEAVAKKLGEEVELDEKKQTAQYTDGGQEKITVTVDNMRKIDIDDIVAPKPGRARKWTKVGKKSEFDRARADLRNSTNEEVELDEAKYDLYHKDFSSAMQHSYKMAKKMYGITVDPKEIDDKVASGPKKPSEGKTNSYRLEGDKGAIQVQVYNKGGSKPFELNMYKEEVELGEEVSVKDFDALKKGDTVTVEYKSAMSSGKGTFAVTAKNKVAKGKVEKVTLKSTKNPGGVKYFLYKRDNKVGFAQGDMGASVVSFKKEEVEEGAAADARRAMRSDPEMKQRAFSKDVSATDDDEKAASKNIMMQLRKAVSLRSYDVEFADGKKQKVNQKIAQAVQNKYNSFRKPADKEKFQAQIAKSYKDMLKTIKSGYGEQKESILEKIDRKIKENKND